MEKQNRVYAPKPLSINPGSALSRLPVHTLMQNRNAVILEHKGQDYCLRITRNGKLILTK
jgi:hemin uptake protein HemP